MAMKQRAKGHRTNENRRDRTLRRKGHAEGDVGIQLCFRTLPGAAETGEGHFLLLPLRPPGPPPRPQHSLHPFSLYAEPVQAMPPLDGVGPMAPGPCSYLSHFGTQPVSWNGDKDNCMWPWVS